MRLTGSTRRPGENRRRRCCCCCRGRIRFHGLPLTIFVPSLPSFASGVSVCLSVCVCESPFLFGFFFFLLLWLCVCGSFSFSSPANRRVSWRGRPFSKQVLSRLYIPGGGLYNLSYKRAVRSKPHRPHAQSPPLPPPSKKESPPSSPQALTWATCAPPTATRQVPKVCGCVGILFFFSSSLSLFQLQKKKKKKICLKEIRNKVSFAHSAPATPTSRVISNCGTRWSDSRRPARRHLSRFFYFYFYFYRKG